MKGKIYLLTVSHGLVTEFYGETEEEQKQNIEAYLARFAELTASWGYESVRPVGDIYGHKYFRWAGTPELRAAQIAEALRAENVAAIFAVDGGGGSKEVTYLLQKMHEQNPFPQNNIPYIGMSDATPIGLYLESIGAVTHCQGSSILELFNLLGESKQFNSPERLEKNQEAFKALLDEPDSPVTFPLFSVNEAAHKPAVIRGKMAGGCNYNVVHACGTFYEPDWHGKILYLEGFEWGELVNSKWVSSGGPGMIEDALEHLQSIGALDKVSAIVAGDIHSGLFPQEIKRRNENALADFAGRLNIPVFRVAPQGHDPQSVKCVPIPMGTNCTIICGESPSLSAEKRRDMTVAIASSSIPNKEPAPQAFATEDIGAIYADDLVPENEAARIKKIEPGMVVGYGEDGDLFNDSLCKTGFFAGEGIKTHLILDAVWFSHSRLTDMLLRGQLKNIQSFIIKKSPERGDVPDAICRDWLNRYLPDVPVYTYSSVEKLFGRLTADLHEKSQSKSWAEKTVLYYSAVRAR